SGTTVPVVLAVLAWHEPWAFSARCQSARLNDGDRRSTMGGIRDYSGTTVPVVRAVLVRPEPWSLLSEMPTSTAERRGLPSHLRRRSCALVARPSRSCVGWWGGLRPGVFSARCQPARLNDGDRRSTMERRSIVTVDTMKGGNHE